MRSTVEVITDLFLDQATTILTYIVAMLLTFAVLRWLPRVRACPDQKFWTHDLKLDLLFSLAATPILFIGLDLIQENFIKPYIYSLPWLNSYHAVAANLPLVLQIILAFLVKDFFGYWRHRAMHWGPLWRFHAIHHATEKMDFANANRFHPGELVGTWMVAILTTVILPLSPIATGILFTIIGIQQLVIHANLRWTYGRLGWLINSPAAHRWHHHPQMGKGHNFSIGLSLFDVIFGTFYLPPGECTTIAGMDQAMPKSFWGLLRYPFEYKKEPLPEPEMKPQQLR
ncbi:MAG: sterol desaturase family protein [Acidobacteriota bacterium]